MLNFWLNYVTLAVAAVLFIAITVTLVVGRKKLAPAVRAALLVVLAVLIVYLAFVLWATLAVGSNPPVEPTPTLSYDTQIEKSSVQLLFFCRGL